jgi:hypothetical protein
MSEKEKKKRQVLDTGRLEGTLSRSSPELYNYLEKESLVTGRKKHEIIEEALSRLILEREVVASGLTMEQLLAAWDIKDRIDRMAMDKMVRFGLDFIRGFLMNVGDMINAIQMSREEQMAKILEEEKKKDIDFQMKRTQAEIIGQVMNVMLPLILNTLQTVYKAQGINIPVVESKTEKKEEMELEVV